MKDQLSLNIKISNKTRSQKTFKVKRVFSANTYKVKVIKNLKSIIFVTSLIDGTNEKRTKIRRYDKYELFTVLSNNLISAKDIELIKAFLQ